MRWSEFERAAPELAGAARKRLEETRIALLGTIRADGSPRISPIEPYFTAHELLCGAMSRSAKAGDLARDPRFVLHSAISDPNAGEPEFKLYGTAAHPKDDAPADAWWLSHAGTADVFALDIHEAVGIRWLLERGEMTVTRWSAKRGLEETTRRYP